jgi:hypothetical protein
MVRTGLGMSCITPRKVRRSLLCEILVARQWEGYILLGGVVEMLNGCIFPF